MGGTSVSCPRAGQNPGSKVHIDRHVVDSPAGGANLGVLVVDQVGRAASKVNPAGNREAEDLYGLGVLDVLNQGDLYQLLVDVHQMLPELNKLGLLLPPPVDHQGVLGGHREG